MAKHGLNTRKPKEQLLVEAAGKRANALYAQGRHEEALQICLQTTSRYPQLAMAWTDAAVNCIKLERWTQAIDYAQRALSHRMMHAERTLTHFRATPHGLENRLLPTTAA